MRVPWEWQAVVGGLHAIPTTVDSPFPPLPGASFTTLCGLDVELTIDDFRRTRRPSCNVCTAAWRKHQDQSARLVKAEKGRASARR